MKSIPNLTLVISEEFTINDLQSLKGSQRNEAISAVRQQAWQAPRKGHHCRYAGSIDLGSLGSANLTEQGLFYNQEASVALSTTLPSDRGVISEMKTWFDWLLRQSNHVDIDHAKAIWAAQSKQRRTIVQKKKAAPT